MGVSTENKPNSLLGNETTGFVRTGHPEDIQNLRSAIETLPAVAEVMFSFTEVSEEGERYFPLEKIPSTIEALSQYASALGYDRDSGDLRENPADKNQYMTTYLEDMLLVHNDQLVPYALIAYASTALKLFEQEVEKGNYKAARTQATLMGRNVVSAELFLGLLLDKQAKTN